MAGRREKDLGPHESEIGPDDTAVLIGDNRPRGIFGEIAAHSLRAPSLGTHRVALDEEAEHVIGDAGCRAMPALVPFLVFEPDGPAHRRRRIEAYWSLSPFPYEAGVR